MKFEKIEVGQIVVGNNSAGKAKHLEGVVVSTSMNAPRRIKVKFKNLGYWLICHDEINLLNENQTTTLTKEFINEALASTKIKISRDKLIELLGRSLNYITDEDLNNEINRVIANHYE